MLERDGVRPLAEPGTDTAALAEMVHIVIRYADTLRDSEKDAKVGLDYAIGMLVADPRYDTNDLSGLMRQAATLQEALANVGMEVEQGLIQ